MKERGSISALGRLKIVYGEFICANPFDDGIELDVFDSLLCLLSLNRTYYPVKCSACFYVLHSPRQTFNEYIKIQDRPETDIFTRTVRGTAVHVRNRLSMGS